MHLITVAGVQLPQSREAILREVGEMEFCYAGKLARMQVIFSFSSPSLSIFVFSPP